MFWFYNQPTYSTPLKIIDFNIKAGEGAITVANNLKKQRLVRSPIFFRVFLSLKNKGSQIKKGIFVLNNSMTSSQIIDIITSGLTKTKSITIPEGFNNKQIAHLLIENQYFNSKKEFDDYASQKKLLQKYNIPAKNIEGYIFPDTYQIPIYYDKNKLLELFLDHFLEKMTTIDNFPKDPSKRHKLIILSSIVEREAKLKEERDLIAGVFVNRLKANYPLESCATIQYLFKKPRPRLFFRDLKIKSPYNTYIHKGLPPSPIASPGIAAIKASLNPQKTNYMFFVIKGDGSHYFSKSFSEHVKAKNRYIGN